MAGDHSFLFVCICFWLLALAYIHAIILIFCFKVFLSVLALAYTKDMLHLLASLYNKPRTTATFYVFTLEWCCPSKTTQILMIAT